MSRALRREGLMWSSIPGLRAGTPRGLVLKDATRTVHVYHIEGSPHADTLLMAYFPRERLLVEADVFTSGAAAAPFAANQAIKSRLEVF